MPKVIIGPLKKGSLMGYHVKNSQYRRRKILSTVVLSKEKPLSTFRKLGALMILTKRRSPKASRVFRKNRAWVKKTFMTQQFGAMRNISIK